MKYTTYRRFVKAEGLSPVRGGCLSCGGPLVNESWVNDQGQTVPRAVCAKCGATWEQTDDYAG